MWRKIKLLIIMVWPILLFAKDTERQLYRPFTETMKHPPAVVYTEKAGECAQQSLLIRREDAWRCIAEGKVYDPCFMKVYGTHHDVICPDFPWSGKSVKITVSTPLDNSQHRTLDMSRTYPWAVELATGEKCQAVDSNEIYDGLPVRYQCENDSKLFGYLQRCATTWKILQHSASGVTTAKIKKAWF